MPDNDLTTHVRRMREKLGITQQEIAHRMKKAISTVVRWESTRAPNGKALVELAEFASSEGLDDYAQIFGEALFAELGPGASLFPRSGFERLLVGATLKALRSHDSQVVAPLLKALAGPVRSYVRERLLEDPPGDEIAVEQIMAITDSVVIRSVSSAADADRPLSEIVAAFTLDKKSAELLEVFKDFQMRERLERYKVDKQKQAKIIPRDRKTRNGKKQ